MIGLIALIALFFAIDPFFDSPFGEAAVFAAGIITIIVAVWLIAAHI